MIVNRKSKIMNKSFFYTALVFFAVTFVFYACQKDYNKPAETAPGIYGTRTEVYVTGIEMDSFPPHDPWGYDWDSIYLPTDTGRFPDIFYKIYHDPDSTNSGFYMHTHFDDVNPNTLPNFYSLTSQFKIYGFDSLMTLDVYDFEKDTATAAVDSTLMTRLTFQVAPGDSLIGNPYPESLMVTNSDYRVKLRLKWK
jgi:hypothetical protein